MKNVKMFCIWIVVAFISGGIFFTVVSDAIRSRGAGTSAIIEPARIDRIDNYTADAIRAVDRAETAVEHVAKHLEHSTGIVDELTRGTVDHQGIVADGTDRIERITERNNQALEILRTAGKTGSMVADDSVQ